MLLITGLGQRILYLKDQKLALTRLYSGNICLECYNIISAVFSDDLCPSYKLHMES